MKKIDFVTMRQASQYNHDVNAQTVTVTRGTRSATFTVDELSGVIAWRDVPMQANRPIFGDDETAYKAACHTVNAYANGERVAKAYNVATRRIELAAKIADDPTKPVDARNDAEANARENLLNVAACVYAVTDGEHAADYADITEWDRYDEFLIACMGAFVTRLPSEIDVMPLYNCFILHGDGTKKPSTNTERKRILSSFLRAVDSLRTESSKCVQLKNVVSALDLAAFNAQRLRGFRQNGKDGEVYIAITNETTFARFIPQWFLFFMQGDAVRKVPKKNEEFLTKLPADEIAAFTLRAEGETIKNTGHKINAAGELVEIGKKITPTTGKEKKPKKRIISEKEYNAFMEFMLAKKNAKKQYETPQGNPAARAESVTA